MDKPEPCPNHDAAHVCDECPDRFDTDGRGFVHRTLLRGRTALRRCACCRGFFPLEQWNTVAWSYCLTCVPAKETR